MMYKDDMREELQRIQKKMGWSVYRLAKEIGISRNTLLVILNVEAPSKWAYKTVQALETFLSEFQEI